MSTASDVKPDVAPEVVARIPPLIDLDAHRWSRSGRVPAGTG